MSLPPEVVRPATAEDAIAHGLNRDEFGRIIELLGRVPNLTELGVFSAMWNEHCSYKSSRVHLKRLPTEGRRVLQGPGENAGAVDIGDGLAAVFKVESHNHPSYIEPFQGAATGVGGILRDVFTMGARPIASLDSLRFGSARAARTPYLLDGVVRGIAFYGNCIGVPTVGGEVDFAPCYDGNILVNAFTVGVCRKDRIFRGRAAGVGNPVIYVGSRTGRDGIHGASMASASFDEEAEAKRPTVQVGDPFAEKLLLEACLELFETDAIVGIQDMGAAGLTSSSVEMAARAGSGIDIDLDLIPVRAEWMTPYELLLSESQERMLLVAQQGREREVAAILQRWGLEAVVVGAVTDTGRVRYRWHGEVVADLPVSVLADEAPVYDRPQRPVDLLARHCIDVDAVVGRCSDVEAALRSMLRDPGQAWASWIWRQFDHMVGAGTLVGPGADAALVRVPGTRKALALSADCNSRWVWLDPFAGGMHAVAQACRNVACMGAEPVGASDCLNFGNPENPEVMWQFAQAIDGVARACREFGVPVVSGNVSFYNQTGDRDIWPTPVIVVVGLLDDFGSMPAHPFGPPAGWCVGLLGRAHATHLAASRWLAVVGGEVAGAPPLVDFAAERRTQELVRSLIRAGHVGGATDVGSGGLAVTLARLVVRTQGRGLRVRLPRGTPPAGSAALVAALFGEDGARFVVWYPPEQRGHIALAAERAGVPFCELGTAGGDRFAIEGALDLPAAEVSDLARDALLRAVPGLAR